MSREKFDLESERELMRHISQHMYDLRELGRSFMELNKLICDEWADRKAYEFCIYMENILNELGRSYEIIEDYYNDLSKHLDNIIR